MSDVEFQSALPIRAMCLLPDAIHDAISKRDSTIFSWETL